MTLVRHKHETRFCTGKTLQSSNTRAPELAIPHLVLHVAMWRAPDLLCS